MAKGKINAGNLRAKDPFYIVEVKSLFPDSEIMKCDIATGKVKEIKLSDDEQELTINDRHTVKLAGKINYEVGDVVYEEEVANEIMGAFLEENRNKSEEGLKKAKRDLEAIENLLKLHSKKMDGKDLGFDKKGKVKEVSFEEDEVVMEMVLEQKD